MGIDRIETACGFIQHALKSEEAEALSDEQRAALQADAEALGFFGLLTSAAVGAEPPEVDPDVRDELSDALGRDLRDALGLENDKTPVGDLFDRYVEAKGERGPDLLTRVIARVIYELYDLKGHGMMQDDVLNACSLLAWGGPGQDARETAKHALRISRRSARATLGHLDQQLEEVHRLSNAEMPIIHATLDRRLHEYAPKVFSQRLPSLAKYLLPEDKQFRFCFVLWARLRGLVVGRAGLIEFSTRIEPARPMLLLQALIEAAPARAAFRAADEAAPLARRIEQAFLARAIPAPA